MVTVGSHPNARRFKFRGDENPLRDIKLLFQSGLGEESIDRLRDRPDRPGAPVVGHQMLEVTLVRNIAEFDQHRRHVGGLEHLEAGGLQRMLVHPRGGLHFVLEQTGKAI